METSDFQVNTAGRERLRSLVSRLTDEELALPAGDGWTIASILAHLAFWDFRVFELIQRWKRAGVGRSPIDMDNINDAMKPLCLAIPVRQAALLAIQAAEMVDDALEHLPDDLPTAWSTHLAEFPDTMSGRRNYLAGRWPAG